MLASRQDRLSGSSAVLCACRGDPLANTAHGRPCDDFGAANPQKLDPRLRERVRKFKPDEFSDVLDIQRLGHPAKHP